MFQELHAGFLLSTSVEEINYFQLKWIHVLALETLDLCLQQPERFKDTRLRFSYSANSMWVYSVLPSIFGTISFILCSMLFLKFINSLGRPLLKPDEN